MQSPYFFGYGSLVNVATHTYVDPRPARLSGWRRAWVQTDVHPLAFLSAVPDSASVISGLVASVPGADWAALDLRETGYDRLPAAEQVDHDLPQETDVQVYSVPKETHITAEPPLPVLLSYLDVVVQGYLQVFGEEGVAGFFETTDSWDRPFVDDRSAPRYPRAQVLDAKETAIVDHWLGKTAAIRVDA